MDLISVIVPVYNASLYLERCVNSIINQTYSNLQIILINDGSTDDSATICDKLAIKDSRIEVIHKNNQGVAEARNCGLNIARGKYIGFIDADDYVELNMYERLYTAIVTSNSDMSVCGYYEEFENKNTITFVTESDHIWNTNETYSEFFKMGGEIGSGVWNKLFYKQAIKDNKYKNYSMGEDIEFICRLINNCKTVSIISYPGYHYIHNKQSATTTNFHIKNTDIISVFHDITRFIDTYRPNLSDNAYAFQASWLVSALQVMYNNYTNKSTEYFEKCNIFKNEIKDNWLKYTNNPKVYWLDIFFLKCFLLGLFRPVNHIFNIHLNIKKHSDLYKK